MQFAVRERDAVVDSSWIPGYEIVVCAYDCGTDARGDVGLEPGDAGAAWSAGAREEYAFVGVACCGLFD